jgi:hypothetical protein
MQNLFDGPDGTLLNTTQQREFFGNRSQMWLTRREKERDKAELRQPGSGLPLPRWIAGRKYRTLGECRAYRDAQPRHRLTPPTKPSWVVDKAETAEA